jgi:hypothetical protein
MEGKLSAFGLHTDALALLNAKDKHKMLNYMNKDLTINFKDALLLLNVRFHGFNHIHCY